MPSKPLKPLEAALLALLEAEALYAKALSGPSVAAGRALEKTGLIRIKYALLGKPPPSPLPLLKDVRRIDKYRYRTVGGGPIQFFEITPKGKRALSRHRRQQTAR